MWRRDRARYRCRIEWGGDGPLFRERPVREWPLPRAREAPESPGTARPRLQASRRRVYLGSVRLQPDPDAVHLKADTTDSRPSELELRADLEKSRLQRVG